MASQSLVGLFILMVGISVASSQSQYHTSDPQGNFKVSYRTSDGQYLVEDRSADGTSLLGNFGYRSSGGEQVGVAYGSDGAGFVIRSPSAAPSTYGTGGVQQQPQQQQQQQPQVVRQHQATNTGQSYNSGSGYDAFLRYQAVNYPASNRAPTSDVTTSSNSLIANGGEVTPSTAIQTPASDLAQHDAGQSYISYYNPAASTPQYHTPSYTAQLPALPTYSPVNYIAPPNAAKSPFTYTFSSYNDPYYNPQYITSQQYVQSAPQYAQPTQNWRYSSNTQRASYQPLPTVATDLRTVIAQTLAHQRQFYNAPSVNSGYPYYGSLVRPYYL